MTYATHDETGAPGTTNIVKPLYHVAWLASRLGMRVVTPLTRRRAAGGGPPLRPSAPGRARRRRCIAASRARLRDHGGDVAVVIRPVASPMPPGTTLRVEILAERRGSELRTDVTAEAENVHVHAWLDGVQEMDRTFKAPRRTEVDLLERGARGRGTRSADGRHDQDGGGGRGRRDDERDATGVPELRGAARPRTRSPRRRRARVASALAEAIAQRGVAHWATTGGSSAPGIYHQLGRSPLRETVDWSRVHVWWGDDRYVPPDHPAVQRRCPWSRSCSPRAATRRRRGRSRRTSAARATASRSRPRRSTRSR